MAVIQMPADTRWSDVGKGFGQGLSQAMMLQMQQDMQNKALQDRAAMDMQQYEQKLNMANRMEQQKRDAMMADLFGYAPQVPMAEGQQPLQVPGLISNMNIPAQNLDLMKAGVRTGQDFSKYMPQPEKQTVLSPGQTVFKGGAPVYTAPGKKGGGLTKIEKLMEAKDRFANNPKKLEMIDKAISKELKNSEGLTEYQQMMQDLRQEANDLRRSQFEARLVKDAEVSVDYWNELNPAQREQVVSYALKNRGIFPKVEKVDRPGFGTGDDFIIDGQTPEQPDTPPQQNDVATQIMRQNEMLLKELKNLKRGL